ncbi:MAG: hypothetical protein ACYC9D_03645 [Candidatus Dormibacteria bacterium]
MQLILLLGGSVLVSSLPYLVARLLSPPGRTFFGFVYLVDDNATYLAKIQEGAAGHWLWTDSYTLTGHAPVLLYTWYLAAGRAAAALHLPALAAWQGLRVLGALVLVVALWLFARRYAEPGGQVLTVALALFASGAGWLTLGLWAGGVLPWPPFDVSDPEISGYYALAAVPHFALLAGLSLLCLLAVHRRARILWAFPAAAAAWAIFPLHPQTPLILGVALALDLGLRWAAGHADRRELGPLLLFAGLCLPPAAYYAWINLTNPLLHSWSTAWYASVPNPVNYLFTLGLLGPLLVLGAWMAWKQDRPNQWLMVTWSATSLALLYLPLPSPALRRSLDGVFAAHAVLVAPALLAVVGWARTRGALAARGAFAALVLGLGLSSGLVIALPYGQVAERPVNLYLAEPDLEVIAWLRDHSSLTTLSGPDTGLLVPALAGNRTWLGHFAETPDFLTRRARLGAYLRSSDPGARQAFAASTGADLLVIGTRERTVLRWDPDREPYLTLAFRSGEAAVYVIRRSAAGAPGG